MYTWLTWLAMSSSNSEASRPSMAFAASASPPSDETQQEIPQLPAADPDSNLPSIKLGETIKFEEMGPIIINPDGTTRRIENWDQMTEREKEVTWRRISKRNEERRKALLEQQRLAEEADQKEEL